MIYEYKVLFLDIDTSQASFSGLHGQGIYQYMHWRNLNELGRDGWKLVGIIAHQRQRSLLDLMLDWWDWLAGKRVRHSEAIGIFIRGQQ